MWLVKNLIVNLWSVTKLERQGCKLTYSFDTNWELVTLDGVRYTFQRDTGVCKGFPYIDMRKDEGGVALLNTVRRSYKGHTKRYVKDAVAARNVQAMIGCSPDRMYKKIVRQQRLDNNPVRLNHIYNDQSIYGKNRARLQGSSMRVQSDRIYTEELSIPRDFYQLHKFETLTMDIMFVNGLAFFVTLSQKIWLNTVEFLPKRTDNYLKAWLMRIVRVYHRGRFTIKLYSWTRSLKNCQRGRISRNKHHSGA